MEAKKISFGFSKITKKLNLLPIKENVRTEAKVELIKCLEGQEIKLVENREKEETPLLIPLKESHKTSAALASLRKRRAVLLGEEEPEPDSAEPSISGNGSPEDIEKRATRELLAEVENKTSSDPANNLVLPVVKPDDLPLEGSKESTLDDYESIPIQEFGKAMLRGMGWIEPVSKSNKKSGAPTDDTPMVRPKGMGLGADKALKKKNLLVPPEANEMLEIKRNAYVIILGGKHKDLYGKIEGFDDHAGRVIVKMAIGGAKEAFNEFLCQPVSRKEYDQYGKFINTRKYEEYKKKENEHGQIVLDKDEMDFIGKSETKIKKGRHDAIEDKYQKNNSHYENKHKIENCKEDNKDIKKESDLYSEEKKYSNGDKRRDHRLPYHKYDSKEIDRESRKDQSRDDYTDSRNYVSDHKRQYDVRDEKEYYRDDVVYREREHKTSEYKSNYSRSHTSSSKNAEDYKNYNTRECEISSKRDSDRQPECVERRKNSQYKTIELDDSSNSEDNSRSFKHKKSKKANSKKSKKSKKKYKKSNSSDNETASSSTDSSSSDSEEDKYKRHKKKTKKSKKQRERSRSSSRR